MTSRSGRLLVDRTFERFGLGQLLHNLRRTGSELFLVGGAVRDALRDPGVMPTDIDIMMSDSFGSIWSAFRQFGPPRVNRHGNLRFEILAGGHLDVINTRRFYGQASSVLDALYHFDASVNAIAVPLDGREFIDPLHGATHIRAGKTALPPARWRLGDPFEDVHVLLRVLRLVERAGLEVINPELAVPHRQLFESVDWKDLRRLNGFGREEAEQRFERTFTWAPTSQESRGPSHFAVPR